MIRTITPSRHIHIFHMACILVVAFSHIVSLCRRRRHGDIHEGELVPDGMGAHYGQVLSRRHSTAAATTTEPVSAVGYLLLLPQIYPRLLHTRNRWVQRHVQSHNRTQYIVALNTVFVSLLLIFLI